ncbi:hypothetical protein WJX84_007142 [Apatococcus fuscideae]|uniref:PDEase domain-containing protein n=1 Tax=Apatococcus fuscideae TaxID=2026836 RepID=A0AAW1TEB1_9CHLO
MHLLMQNGLIKLGVLQDVMVLACYLAAICHDFEHPGVNNDFLIKTGNRKALMYNDISPLENHHVSASFMVAADKRQANIFQGMSEEDRGTLRASMIDLILGTDMKKHFGLLSRFQGDQEQQHRLKVSPLMDRNEASGMTKSQVGFFEIVALPLFTGYTQLVPDAKPLLDAVMSNYQHWHAGAKE